MIIVSIIIGAALLVLLGEQVQAKFPELYKGDGDEDGEGGMQ